MSAPETIAVCVCSYERPASLARCLASLERLAVGWAGDEAVRLIVVDNARSRTAEPVVARHAGTSRFRVDYVSEPKKGLSQARNAALRAALAAEVDAFAFIDDDEVATPGWLAALRDTLGRTGAPAALGAVHPIFERRPPAWAVRGGFFADCDPPNAEAAQEGRTNNVIIDCAALRAENVAFDPAYDDVGGEDTAFFRTLQRRGWRIAIAADAVVHEWIPERRVAVAWLARRWFRTGGVEARCQDRPYGSPSGRVMAAGRGLARIGAGGALTAGTALAHGWRDPSRVVRRLFTVARGGGLLASAFGVENREYAAPRIEERPE